MERRIYSPHPDSDLFISASDNRNVRFLKRGGLVLGNSIESDNVRLNRATSAILELTTGDDLTSDGSYSDNKVSLAIKTMVVGSASASDNVRLHRNASLSLQFVPGDDVTPEETSSPNPLILPGMLLPGTIINWLGGYFADGNNGVYTRVLGSANNVTGANAYLNSMGWYVCDGSEINVPNSPIFDGAGKFLPNISDERFLEGNNTGGSIGGINNKSHTHTITPNVSVSVQPEFNMPGHYHSSGTLAMGNETVSHTHSGSNSSSVPAGGSHAHTYTAYTFSTSYWTYGYWEACNHTYTSTTSGVAGGSSDHSHTFSGSFTSNSASVTHNHAQSGRVGSGSDGDSSIACTRTANLSLNNPSFTSDTGSNTENRPKYLSVFYIMRVI